MIRRWRRAGGGLLGLALLSGCGFNGLYGVHLPGGGVQGGTRTVTVVFDNVLDLVPQSSVKVGDVTVGTVENITITPGLKAEVRCSVAKSTRLPANAVAVLQETSLLGEKFIQLGAPETGPAGPMTDGDMRIENVSSSAYPDIEVVFGVLSSVLNGGGLEKLQTISYELSQALAGREGQIRDLVNQLSTFVGGLDAQKSEIVRALDSLNRLSGHLAAQTQTIATALDDLGPGLKVLADERAQLTALLTSLANLGVVSTRVINASVDATRTDLAALQPILGQLQQAGQGLPRALELLLDYPFPKNSTDGIPGDYTSLSAKLNTGSLCNVAALPICPTLPPVPPAAGAGAPPPAPLSVPTLPVPGGLPPAPVHLPPAGPGGGLLGLLRGGLA